MITRRRRSDEAQGGRIGPRVSGGCPGGPRAGWAHLGRRVVAGEAGGWRLANFREGRGGSSGVKGQRGKGPEGKGLFLGVVVTCVLPRTLVCLIIAAHVLLRGITPHTCPF